MKIIRYSILPLLLFSCAVVYVCTLLPGQTGVPDSSVKQVQSTEPASVYADPASCVECHPKEVASWEKSDHAHAMAIAGTETVKGDFNEITFIHIGFDDILSIPDDILKEVFETEFDAPDLALALEGAKDGIREKIVRNLNETQRNELDAESEHLKKIGFSRPGDISIVHRKFGDVIRKTCEKNDISLDFATKTRFFRKDGKYFVSTENREGNLETFEVKYTLGHKPLQQYMVEFPDGRVQCLPIAWDVNDESWFHLYPKEQILHDDPLHWTGFYQNWNSNCADCHTTNLHKNFDLRTNTFKTAWSEIHVGCQSCHGPSENHVVTAKKHALKEKWDDKYPIGIYKWTDSTEDLHIDSCSACHARRRTLCEGPLPPGEKFLNHFSPDLLDGNLYYADGQLLEENFEYGSFQQARMYHQGVQCGDCHDVHSGTLKFEGNALCTQCHSPGIYDTVAHHFHPDATQEGTGCIDCHLPKTYYMVVDPRRDHSITKPRPELTKGLGVPNACNICHNDRKKGEDVDWAIKCVDEWYGEKRNSAVGYTKDLKTATHFAFALDGGRQYDPDALDSLISISKQRNGRELRPIARASTIILLGRYPDPKAFEPCELAIKDDNPLVRWAGLIALERKLDPRQKKEVIGPFLEDPIRTIRIEAARILASVPADFWSKEETTALNNATKEYVDSLKTTAESPGSHLNMGILKYDQAIGYLYGKRIDPDVIKRSTEPAVREYREAIRLDSKFLPAKVNLAMLYAERGEPDLAEREFRNAISVEPDNGELHYSLGLLLAERNRLKDAINSLQRAAELLPDGHRVHYNLGTALKMDNREEEARKALERY